MVDLATFKADAKQHSAEHLVDTYILGNYVPTAFVPEPSHHDIVLETFSKQLHVPKDMVMVVGSAKLGFALNPANFPREFCEASDIDIAIVSETLFDDIWYKLLSWRYSVDGSYGGKTKDWCLDLFSKLSKGWIIPVDLYLDSDIARPATRTFASLRATWFDCCKRLTSIPVIASREVNARLYRTREHMRRYQLFGMEVVKRTVINNY